MFLVNMMEFDGLSLQMRIGLSREGNDDGMQGAGFVVIVTAVVVLLVGRVVVLVVVFARVVVNVFATVVAFVVLALDTTPEPAGVARLHGEG
jgi:hypothetical protein